MTQKIVTFFSPLWSVPHFFWAHYVKKLSQNMVAHMNFTHRAVETMRPPAREQHMSTRRLAKLFMCSSATISYCLRASHHQNERFPPPPRSPHASVSKRRKVLKTLVDKKITTDKRIVPQFPSTARLRAELQSKGYNVSRETVRTDLVGLVP